MGRGLGGAVGETMRGSPLIAILLVLPVAVTALAAQGATATSDLAINVVSAEDLGCTDDTLAGPADLRVTVSVDGQARLQTVKAQDQDNPEYAAFTLIQAVELPATIQVVIQEAEPGGFLGTGTSWETCDAAPGASSTYEVTWEGDQRELVARGDGERAAEAIVVVGPEAPSRPALSEEATGTDQVTLAWEGGTHEAITGHRLRWAQVGDQLHEAGPSAGQHTVRDLCDNTAYTFQVVRDAEPWHIASDPLEVTTANQAPQAPIIVRANTTDGNLTVAWLLPTSHDLERLDLHAARTGTFQPDETTRLATYRGPLGFQPVETTVTDVPTEATHVRVVATDTGGLSATSEPFAIGGEARDPGTIPESEDAGCPGAADRINHSSPLTDSAPDELEQAPSATGRSVPIEEPEASQPTTQDPTPPGPQAQQPTEPAPQGLSGVGVWIGLVAGMAIALAVVAIVLVLTGRA